MAAGSLRDQGSVDAVESKGSVEAEFPPSLGEVNLSLLISSTDCMRPTHIMEDNLPYSDSTDQTGNPHLKTTFIATSRPVFEI